ncbi:unnamed protein product [Sphenostylis stenocarpa]|uniref:Uncharacterized protein n=1 Tax=Sphenostylis stenocarpa TaxID=92480 RepID=A0AA86T3E7_9FABA|nr:unnamed protein product [Sphenostylis stenocarpa]
MGNSHGLHGVEGQTIGDRFHQTSSTSLVEELAFLRGEALLGEHTNTNILGHRNPNSTIFTDRNKTTQQPSSFSALPVFQTPVITFLANTFPKCVDKKRLP